ncbi:MAG: hypothetical protein WC314_03385 [Vulcanimicrobiota bacterium]
MNDLNFPELSQAVLDPPTLQALLRDLTTQTRVLSVTVKGGEQHHAQAADSSLSQAVESLLRGEIRGVQVRYLWQDREWLDTLLRCAEGIRIVRSYHEIGTP